MLPEIEPKQPLHVRSLNSIRQHPWLATIALVTAMGGAAKAGYELDSYMGESGTTQLLEPLKPTKQPVNVDNELIVINWNMHGEIKYKERRDDLAKLVETEKPDVLLLQETTAADPERLQRLFKKASVYFMLADKKQEIASGGFGQTMVVLGQYGLKKLPTKSLSGKSTLATVTSTTEGLIKDVAQGDGDMENAREAMRENRVIGGLVLKGWDGYKLQDIQVMTTHIGGQKDVQSHQYPDALNYLKDRRKKEVPSVVCGDFNTRPDPAIDDLKNAGYYADKTEPTAVDRYNNPMTIDFCATDAAGKLGLTETTVLKKYTTDHSALKFKVKIKAPNQ